LESVGGDSLAVEVESRWFRRFYR